MNSDFRSVFRTGRVYELDIARTTLNDAGIPSYAREEDAGGIVTAIPGSPMAGPGAWFHLLVPVDRLADAREALSHAPIELDLHGEPEFWHFNPSQRGRLHWRLYAGFALLVSAVIAILEVLKHL